MARKKKQETHNERGQRIIQVTRPERKPESARMGALSAVDGPKKNEDGAGRKTITKKYSRRLEKASDNGYFEFRSGAMVPAGTKRPINDNDRGEG